MATDLMTRDDLVRSIADLPAETVTELRQFVDFLRFKSQQPRRIVRLGGLWKDQPLLTDEDITLSRREAWGRFGERYP
jgi:hypothetical protein